MSTPVTTRTGRRVVPTQAAAAAAESKSTAASAAASSSGGGGGGSAASSSGTTKGADSEKANVPLADRPGPASRKSARATRTAAAGKEKVVEEKTEKEKPKETPKPKEKEVQSTRVATRKETRASTAAPATTSSTSTPAAATPSAEAPKKRGGLRNTRQSSGSAEDSTAEDGASGGTSGSGPPAKKAKASNVSEAPATPAKGKVASVAAEKKKAGATTEQKDGQKEKETVPAAPRPTSPSKVEAVAIAKKSPAKVSSPAAAKSPRGDSQPAEAEASKQQQSETEEEEESHHQTISVDEHGTPVMAAAGNSFGGVSAEDENDHSDLLIQKIEGHGQAQAQAESSSSSMDTQIIHVESDNHHRTAADLIEAQMAILHQGNLEDHLNQQQQQITVLSGQHGDLAASLISIGSVGQLSADGSTVVVGHLEESLGMENPPWNEQGCIICNADLSVDDITNPAVKNHEKMKEFFLEFFSVGDQISMDEENTFPFCMKCAEDMESLMGINHKIEFMHKQFNKVRDSVAKKTIKTFLARTKPNCLEEDSKSENFGFMEEEHKKPYKEQMFNLWRSRYELVQPGPKTPVMIRSMDSRGRVTVVRLNSQGQPIPDKFGTLKRFSGADMPIPGGLGGRVSQTNGGDNDGDESGNSIDIYKCNECPKSFNTKIMLAYHSRIHTGELPFECELCGKAFSVPHYLMTHMRSHTGEKPYKCDECGKGFAQRGGLVTHALVHSGAKPYSCEICGKSFRQKYHLTQHMLIHSGVKPFKCDLCGKDFNVKMNLREHMRRHTGDRPYKCPYCTTIGFFRKKMLKEHIGKAHPQRPMPVELMGETESAAVPSSSVVASAAADSNDSSQSTEEGHEVHEDEMEEDEDIMDMEEAEAMPTHHAKVEA